MTYRRILSLAAGATVFAGGLFTLANSTSSGHYKGSRLNDNGLKNYTFIDLKKFDLINVSILTRHGARTPNYYVDSKYEMPDWESGIGYVDLLPDLTYLADVKELPSNTLINEDSVQEEYIQHNKGRRLWGQLTLIGQDQSIAFGKELRRIYMQGCKFVHQDFDENEILCRSTKFPRTFYSLKGILSGFYGSDSFDECHRPIIYTMPISTDTMYPNTNTCSVLNNFMTTGSLEVAKDTDIIRMKCLLRRILGVEHLRFTSPDSARNSRKCEKHVDNISENKGDDKVTVYAVRDDIISRQVHDFPVPTLFNSLLPEINRLSSQEVLFEYLGGSNEWEDRMPIIVSPVINFIKNHMKTNAEDCILSGQNKACVANLKDAIMKKKNKMKMQLLACHDTTLIPLLLCLRIYDGQWPIFMANLIIELYKEKETNKLFTRVLYCGNVQNLKISETCNETNEYEKNGLLPYGEFVNLLDKYSFPDEHYVSACDKAMKLFTSGKPITKDHYI